MGLLQKVIAGASVCFLEVVNDEAMRIRIFSSMGLKMVKVLTNPSTARVKRREARVLEGHDLNIMVNNNDTTDRAGKSML